MTTSYQIKLTDGAEIVCKANGKCELVNRSGKVLRAGAYRACIAYARQLGMRVIS